MSIIMLAPEAQRVDQCQECEASLAPSIRALLDHIAAELAEEYVRLMERAAEADGGAIEGEKE